MNIPRVIFCVDQTEQVFDFFEGIFFFFFPLYSVLVIALKTKWEFVYNEQGTNECRELVQVISPGPEARILIVSGWHVVFFLFH